jgi:hypothetical protein
MDLWARSDDERGNEKTLPMYPWAVACVTQSHHASAPTPGAEPAAFSGQRLKAEANDGDLMKRVCRCRHARAKLAPPLPAARTAPSLSLLEIRGTRSVRARA